VLKSPHSASVAVRLFFFRMTGTLSRGPLEMGMTQITEILAYPGVTYAGPLFTIHGNL
jgi:hypothetical protein